MWRGGKGERGKVERQKGVNGEWWKDGKVERGKGGKTERWKGEKRKDNKSAPD